MMGRTALFVAMMLSSSFAKPSNQTNNDLFNRTTCIVALLDADADFSHSLTRAEYFATLQALTPPPCRSSWTTTTTTRSNIFLPNGPVMSDFIECTCLCREFAYGETDERCCQKEEATSRSILLPNYHYPIEYLDRLCAAFADTLIVQCPMLMEDENGNNTVAESGSTEQPESSNILQRPTSFPTLLSEEEGLAPATEPSMFPTLLEIDEIERIAPTIAPSTSFPTLVELEDAGKTTVPTIVPNTLSPTAMTVQDEEASEETAFPTVMSTSMPATKGDDETVTAPNAQLVPTLAPLRQPVLLSPNESATSSASDRNQISTTRNSVTDPTVLVVACLLAALLFCFGALLLVWKSDRTEENYHRHARRRLDAILIKSSTIGTGETRSLDGATTISGQSVDTSSLTAYETEHNDDEDPHRAALLLPACLTPPKEKKKKRMRRNATQNDDDDDHFVVGERAPRILQRPSPPKGKAPVVRQETPPSPRHQQITSLIQTLDLESSSPSPPPPPPSAPQSGADEAEHIFEDASDDDRETDDTSAPTRRLSVQNPTRSRPKSPDPQKGAWEEFQKLSKHEKLPPGAYIV